MGTEECQDWFKEIVLIDYTESQLLNTEPKLIVLSPFTLPTETDKASVLDKDCEYGAIKSSKLFQASNRLMIF
ncbi:MAG TPA: hypothetical protein EYP59_01260 [Thiotrichaceae bacterium]|nr:hypothetical protein [Thiotrichaceae bacterium]